MSQSIYKDRPVSFFNRVIRAIKGEEMDYTQVSIRSAIFMLAIPMMLEMAMESVFALVDLYFVGHLEESSAAIQTVSLTESVLTVIYSLAIGMSMAATAMVARRVGEKKPEEAARAGVQVLIIAIAVTVTLSIIGMVFASDILRLMGGSPAVVSHGTVFVRIMMGSSVVIMLLFLINGIFRGAGNAAIAMKSLAVANVCNIILCIVLVGGYGPFGSLGLTGAAIATAVGRGIGVIYQLYYLFRGNQQLRVRLEHWKPDFSLIRAIIKLSAPAVFQFVIASCSWIFLAKWVAETGGDHGSAGYQTALRLMMFFMLPAWGLSNAAATLVGQNLGAKQPQRASDSVMQTTLYNVIFMGVVMILFFACGHWFVGLFTNDPEVRRVGVQALRILSAGFIFYGVGMVMINAFNGAGDTWTPTWVNLVCFWMIQVPLAYMLAIHFAWGPSGVFIAVPVAETVVAIVAFILFRRGKWQKVNI